MTTSQKFLKQLSSDFLLVIDFFIYGYDVMIDPKMYDIISDDTTVLSITYEGNQEYSISKADLATIKVDSEGKNWSILTNNSRVGVTFYNQAALS
jgi:hypothetical protein